MTGSGLIALATNAYPKHIEHLSYSVKFTKLNLKVCKFLFVFFLKIQCEANLTARRCEPYTKYPSDFTLGGPHTKIEGKSGLSQAESMGIPLFNYITSGNISGYTGEIF